MQSKALRRAQQERILDGNKRREPVESRVWKCRDTTDHRKPERAHWMWLLVGNES